MTHPAPSSPQSKSAAHAATLLLWLERGAGLVLAFLNAPLARRVVDLFDGFASASLYLRKLDRYLKGLIVLRASMRLREYAAPRRKPARLCGVAPGARRAGKGTSVFRRITNGVLPKARGNLRARLARLLRILSNLDRYIARVMQRIRKGFRTKLLIVRPYSDAKLRVIAARAAEAFDTS